MTPLPCARTAVSAQEPTAPCDRQVRGALSATKGASVLTAATKPSEQLSLALSAILASSPS